MTPETLTRATRGDRAARRALLDMYGPMVFGLCRRLSARDPEDAYQDVWIKVFEALPGVEPSRVAQLRGWIATVTHRCLVDRHRRASRRTHAPLKREPPSREVPADDRVEDAQRVDALERALHGLPSSQRRVVVMFHLEGQSLLQIADVEGVAVGTVKSRLSRAKGALARLLRGDAFYGGTS